jgi:hypothetical protein
MAQSELAAFRRKLDEFSAQLDTRMREFKEKGRFSELDRGFSAEAQARADQLRGRVAEAAEHGTPWDLLKAQVERDFNTLVDDIAALERRFDAQFAGDHAPQG